MVHRRREDHNRETLTTRAESISHSMFQTLLGFESREKKLKYLLPIKVASNIEGLWRAALLPARAWSHSLQVDLLSAARAKKHSGSRPNCAGGAGMESGLCLGAIRGWINDFHGDRLAQRAFQGIRNPLHILHNGIVRVSWALTVSVSSSVGSFQINCEATKRDPITPYQKETSFLPSRLVGHLGHI